MGTVLLFSQPRPCEYTVYRGIANLWRTASIGESIFFLVMTVMAACSVADPEPHGSAIILVRFIWIRIRIGNTDPVPDPGGPK
jgi:hypothetical protein